MPTMQLNLAEATAFAGYIERGPDELWLDPACVARGFGVGDTYLQGVQALLEMYFHRAWPGAGCYGDPIEITGLAEPVGCTVDPSTLGFGNSEVIGGTVNLEPVCGGVLPVAITPADTTRMWEAVEGRDVQSQILNTLTEFCDLVNQTLQGLPLLWALRRETRGEHAAHRRSTNDGNRSEYRQLTKGLHP